MTLNDDDIRFICEDILKPSFEAFLDPVTRITDAQFDEIKKTILELCDHIENIKYENFRDKMFIASILSAVGRLDKESINDAYREFCQGFDATNRKEADDYDSIRLL